MTVYYITLVAAFILFAFAENALYIERTTSTKVFFIMGSIVLICVAGLRYAVGADYFAYYSYYEKYAAELVSSIRTFNEPGFKLLCWLIVKLGGTNLTLIFVCSLITIGIFCLTIYRETDQFLSVMTLFVFLGCWHSSFNAIRQCMAAAIVFYGVKYIRDRNLLKYALIILVASSFHISAVVMIFPYFIAHNKVRIRNVILLVAASVVVLNSFDRVLMITGNLLSTSFSASDSYINSSVNMFRVFAAIAPAIFFLLAIPKDDEDVFQKTYLNFLIINGIALLATSNSTYLARIGVFTAPFVALGIPGLLQYMSEGNRKIASFFIYPLYAFYWWYEVSHSVNLNTFQFIWQM